MRTCHNCGNELSDQATFCHYCGASDTIHEGSKINVGKMMNQQVVMPKTVFNIVMLALALMGLAIIGLTVRGPSTVTRTDYVTQMQLATVSITSSTTMTTLSTMTVASFATLSGPQSSWFNQQYCGYPFNPYLCNEGPPVTLTGYLTSDSSCVNLYVETGQNYVVWNLPKNHPTGAVQVYGFVYPNWPQTQPFPPYPFQKTICVGTPLWAISPYIQST